MFPDILPNSSPIFSPFLQFSFTFDLLHRCTFPFVPQKTFLNPLLFHSWIYHLHDSTAGRTHYKRQVMQQRFGSADHRVVSWIKPRKAFPSTPLSPSTLPVGELFLVCSPPPFLNAPSSFRISLSKGGKYYPIFSSTLSRAFMFLLTDPRFLRGSGTHHFKPPFWQKPQCSVPQSFFIHDFLSDWNVFSRRIAILGPRQSRREFMVLAVMDLVGD